MEKLKETIAKTIVDSLEHDFLDKKYSLDLDSHNYLAMMKSDVINTNLKKQFNSERYIIHQFNRFAWEGRFILDLETKSLISITTISNLNHVPKVKDRKIPHYMQTLLYCLNDEIKTNQQMCFEELEGFEGFEEFDSAVYEEDFERILSGLDVNFEEFTYYVVTYDFKFNKVIDMNWHLLGSGFNTAEKTSMMEYVKPDFVDLTVSQEVTDEQDKSINEQSRPRKGIKLGLKGEILKKEG